jgi:hypothetical protein
VPTGYSDSDYAGDPDERKSTSGYLFSIGSGLTTWNSKKQGEVARSSAEAEYRAVAEATKEALWLRNIMDELGMKLVKPITIGCDNQSCIRMATNPVLHERTKHIEAQCHFIRDNIKKNRIELKYVRSQQQYADILTKALARPRFEELRDMIGMMTKTEFDALKVWLY